MKIQRMNDLEAKRGRLPWRDHRSGRRRFPSVKFTEALIRLLMPDNRSLLRTIRDAKTSVRRRIGAADQPCGVEFVTHLGQARSVRTFGNAVDRSPPRADDENRKAAYRYRPVRHERQDRNESGIVSR